MRSAAVALVLVVLGGCSTAERPEPVVRVARSAFFVGTEQVGTAAVLRVDGSRTVTDIELSITFFAADRELGRETDRLPFCPPSTDCPWGQRLYGEHLGRRWRDIDRVTVEVTGHGAKTRRELGVEELSTRVTDEVAIVRPAGVEGTAYLLAYDGDTPRTGVSFFIAEGDRHALWYSRRLFERPAGGEVRAYLYPGRTPASVRGPGH